METSLIEKVKRLPVDKKKEVEDFVDFLLSKTKKEIQESLNDAVKPGFGGGKGLIAYMAEDFDAPLDDFKDYM